MHCTHCAQRTGGVCFQIILWSMAQWERHSFCIQSVNWTRLHQCLCFLASFVFALIESGGFLWLFENDVALSKKCPVFTQILWRNCAVCIRVTICYSPITEGYSVNTMTTRCERYRLIVTGNVECSITDIFSLHGTALNLWCEYIFYIFAWQKDSLNKLKEIILYFVGRKEEKRKKSFEHTLASWRKPGKIKVNSTCLSQ